MSENSREHYMLSEDLWFTKRDGAGPTGHVAVIWNNTSWPEFSAKQGRVRRPLLLLWESPFSWEPEALGLKLSLEPCWSVTMEITLVTHKPSTSPDTQVPHSDSQKDFSAPTLTSLEFISAGILLQNVRRLAFKCHYKSERREGLAGVSRF